MAANDLRTCGSRLLRRGRISATSHVYLVTFATFERNRCFADFDAACIASRVLSDRKFWRDSKLLAWVLMPDHWHDLVQPGGRDSLSQCVARAKSAVTRELRRLEKRPLRVWASGFHDRAVRREDDLRAMARYLVLNPVRARLVRSPWEYSFWDAAWIGSIRQGLE